MTIKYAQAEIDIEPFVIRLDGFTKEQIKKLKKNEINEELADILLFHVKDQLLKQNSITIF